MLFRSRLQLTRQSQTDASPLAAVQTWLDSDPQAGAVVLDAADRRLNLPELQAIAELLRSRGLRLQRLEAEQPLSLVPAAALGLETLLRDPAANASDTNPGDTDNGDANNNEAALTIHRGTLRSGDHLQVQGSVLVLGDVNPGARVSAGGDVRVWGRLRGVAHAGCNGNRQARIVALQLRPLQLRISEAVARGPEDQPPPGFCEEALLEGGAIAIRPADPIWPSGAGGR